MENTTVNVKAVETEDTESKIIFNFRVARSLVKLGNKIVDLKINRVNKKCLFVFEDSLKFRKDWQRIVNENKKWREERAKEQAEVKTSAGEASEPMIEQAD